MARSKQFSMILSVKCESIPYARMEPIISPIATVPILSHEFLVIGSIVPYFMVLCHV